MPKGQETSDAVCPGPTAPKTTADLARLIGQDMRDVVSGKLAPGRPEREAPTQSNSCGG
jgi:hypothetical protein